MVVNSSRLIDGFCANMEFQTFYYLSFIDHVLHIPKIKICLKGKSVIF